MRSMDTTPINTAATLATIERYISTWNEADDAHRARTSREVWAADGLLADPLVEAVGPDAISAAIGALRSQMPGHSMNVVTRIDAHHDHARFGWTVSGPDGSVAIAGLDVVTFAADGRIARAIGFFGDIVSV